MTTQDDLREIISSIRAAWRSEGGATDYNSQFMQWLRQTNIMVNTAEHWAPNARDQAARELRAFQNAVGALARSDQKLTYDGAVARRLLPSLSRLNPVIKGLKELVYECKQTDLFNLYTQADNWHWAVLLFVTEYAAGWTSEDAEELGAEFALVGSIVGNGADESLIRARKLPLPDKAGRVFPVLRRLWVQAGRPAVGSGSAAGRASRSTRTRSQSPPRDEIQNDRSDRRERSLPSHLFAHPHYKLQYMRY